MAQLGNCTNESVMYVNSPQFYLRLALCVRSWALKPPARKARDGNLLAGVPSKEEQQPEEEEVVEARRQIYGNRDALLMTTC